MKKIKDIIIGFILGIIVLGGLSVYAVEAVIESKEVSYDNKSSKGNYNNVQDSIDELYRRSGILEEEWKDPILHGADPVLKDPLVPITIDDDGTVKYANLYTKWYEYETKRWANAVILVDSEKGKYKTGDTIPQEAIESYFVWIPRYKYKIWNLGEYNKAYNFSELKDSADTVESDLASSRFNNGSRLIDIIFGDIANVQAMKETEAKLNQYYTHPAFTLGTTELNGLWVGKFETGGDGTNIIVKPNVVSWRLATVGTFWHKLYDYKRDLDSHMMKNTEWGAVAYLSHSIYGIGREININNNSEYKTGYSATTDSDQSAYPGKSGTTKDVTQPWNTSTGYLASTTGNISGIYDMSGGAHEYMAAYMDGYGDDISGLTSDELNKNSQYFDKYASSNSTSYNNRILGDATGEMGPFYNYYDKDKKARYHNAWYADDSYFVDSENAWFDRSGDYTSGMLGGQFYFVRYTGGVDSGIGSHLVLSVN